MARGTKKMIKTDGVIYHTETQKEYDWLTEKLEEAGCKCNVSQIPPTKMDGWRDYGSETGLLVLKNVIWHINFVDDIDTKDYDYIEVSDLMENEIKTDKVIYHTKRQEEYNWLMQKLEADGCKWVYGELPTKFNDWGQYSTETCIRLKDKIMDYADFDFYKNESAYQDYEFIEVSDLMGQPYKDTKGKPKLSLVPPQVLFDIAEVREYGNAKYPADGADNWKRVDINDYKDALLRHTMKYIQNPKGKDEESGIEHYKHMACNIAFICEMERKDEKNWDMQDLR